MPPEADKLTEARKTAKALPLQIRDASIACPLCNALVPVRGIKEQLVAQQDAAWQLLFTCPACGLITRFAVSRVSLKQLNALSGSAWTNELRQYQWSQKEGNVAHERSARPYHFVSVFVISFLTW